MARDEALKVRTVRLGDDDLANVKALQLGDETFSQVVRRILREAATRQKKARGR